MAGRITIPATTPPNKRTATNAGLCCGGFFGLSPRSALPLPHEEGMGL